MSYMKHRIKMLYEESESIQKEKHTTKTVSVVLPIEVAAMLRALADRFGKPMSTLAAEVLEDETKLAFLHLKPEDQKLLAEKADSEITDFYEKRGIPLPAPSDPAETSSGSVYWYEAYNIGMPEIEEGYSDEADFK